MNFAYIDPGTGSLLFSVLIALGITLVYTLKNFFYNSISIITGKKINLSPNFPSQLVFYSEGTKYWQVFKPIFDVLLAEKKSFVFLSSEKDDPGLVYLQSYENITAQCIGKIQQAILFLNRLEADILVMTTPQLNVMQMKRSKKVRHYCYIAHAPIDVHTYKFYAFDEFDSVLCPSKAFLANLRFLEQLRQGKPKLLLETGCTYYDEMASGENTQRFDEKLVLYAPTWGDKSSLSIGREIMEDLLGKGFHVVFRPHPQSFVSDLGLLDNIRQHFAQTQNWIFDEEPSFAKAFSSCTVMLCDLSGIVYDFAFLQQKPIFALNTSHSLELGFEAYYLEQEVSITSLLQATGGELVELVLASNISAIIERGMAQAQKKFVREDYIYNFQDAAAVAAKQILSLQEFQQ